MTLLPVLRNKTEKIKNFILHSFQPQKITTCFKSIAKEASKLKSSNSITQVSSRRSSNFNKVSRIFFEVSSRKDTPRS